MRQTSDLVAGSNKYYPTWFHYYLIGNQKLEFLEYLNQQNQIHLNI